MSDAVAVTFTLPDTVAPLVGEVIKANGTVVSAVWFETVIETTVELP